MAEPSSTNLDPAAEKAADTEPQLAKEETELATNPQSTQEAEKTGDTTTTSTTGSSVTEIASNATTTAATAAAGVKDSVFSMFGGGAPKEKKPEPEDDADEPSGSSKKKNDEEEVSVYLLVESLISAVGHQRLSVVFQCLGLSQEIAYLIIHRGTGIPY